MIFLLTVGDKVDIQVLMGVEQEIIGELDLNKAELVGNKRWTF